MRDVKGLLEFVDRSRCQMDPFRIAHVLLDLQLLYVLPKSGDWCNTRVLQSDDLRN
jgi:hypothetical protein